MTKCSRKSPSTASASPRRHARPPPPPRHAELHAVAHAREPVAQGLGARDGRAPRDAALARAEARLADRVQRGRVPPAHPALELALVGGGRAPPPPPHRAAPPPARGRARGAPEAEARGGAPR